MLERLLLMAVLFCFPDFSYGSDLVSKEEEIRQFLDFNSDTYRKIGIQAFNGQYQWRYPNEVVSDPDLGYRHVPNGEVRHIVRTDTEVVFDVTYHFDKFGRRKSEVTKKGSRNRFIALFGCSFVYGNAIQDNETLNYFFAKELERYYPYNYGIAASGANTVLALAESGRLKKEIPQKSGVFLYFFIESHVNRTVGNLPTLSWNFETPFYEIVNGKAERNGSFATGRPFTTRFLLGAYSFLTKYTSFGNREFPPTSNKDQLATCAILSGVKDRLERDFPFSPFFVVKHAIGGKMDPVLEDCLKEKNVSVLSFSKEFLKQFESKDANLNVKNDGHPNGLANQKIVSELVKIFQEQKVIQ